MYSQKSRSNYFVLRDNRPTLIRQNKWNEDCASVPYATFDGRRTRLQYFEASANATLCVAYSWVPYGEGVAVLYGATILPKHEGRPMARLIAKGRRAKAPQFAVVASHDWGTNRSAVLRGLPTRYGCRGTRLVLPKEPPALGCPACGGNATGGWDADQMVWDAADCACKQSAAPPPPLI